MMQMNLLFIVLLHVTFTTILMGGIVNGVRMNHISTRNMFSIGQRLQKRLHGSSTNHDVQPCRRGYVNLLNSRGGSSSTAVEEAVEGAVEGAVASAENESSPLVHSNDVSSNCDLSYDAEESTTLQNQKAQEQKELDTERIIHTHWQKYTRLVQLAKIRRKKNIRSRRACLGLVCSGVSLQTLSSQLPKTGGILAILGSISIAATPMLQKLAAKEKEMFVQSNAATEEMAREIYLFRAGIAPYDSDSALEDFVHKGREIFDGIEDPMYLMMKHDGSHPPPKLDINTYTDLRAVPMKEKYVKELQTFVRWSGFFSKVRDGCLGASSLIGLLCSRPMISAATKSIGPWSSVMATLGSAFAVHLESNKFEELSKECAKAASDLETVLILPKDYESFVHSCEDIIASTTKSIGRIRSTKPDDDEESGKGQSREPKWNPDVVCGDSDSGFYPASARAQWLMENKDMSEDEAKEKVMREYPSMFLYQLN